MPRTYIVVAALLLLAALSAPSSARERPFGDEFLLTYGKLESYCDSGTHFPGTASNNAAPKTFERCVHRDGRFKKTERATTDDPSIEVEWSDGSRLFSLNRYANYLGALEFSYNETPLAHGYEATEHLARTILEWFEIATPARASMREYLNSFSRRADLDRDGFIASTSSPRAVFQRHQAIYCGGFCGGAALGMCFLVARHLVEMPRRAAHSQSRQHS